MKDLSKNASRILTAVALAGFAVFLWLAYKGIALGPYEARIVRLSGIYAIAALSMNLINGFTGQFSLGQAGFMALGAYTTSLLVIPPEAKESLYWVEPINPFVRNLQAPFLVALIAGGLMASFFAFFIGFPVLRLKGDYLAIATLGFSEIIRIFITNLIPITNGPVGLKNIPSTANILWTSLSCAAIVVLLLRLMKTSYGRTFKAIRDDEVAAEAMGISLFKHKLMSFLLSAFIAGISGGLLASVVGAITPAYFRFTLAYEILLIVVLGGQGSITGSVVGAIILSVSKEWLRFLDSGFNLLFFRVPEIAGLRMLVFSLLLMAIILFYRRGLFGSREFSWNSIYRPIAFLINKIRKPKKEAGDDSA
ncbi:MAG: branched-chain amino acid ABC transporter permease [Eubacteriaceae bacterium]|nr:branched-chain amino acid ABC transporter permease [Eubacteriaceae bacterium]